MRYFGFLAHQVSFRRACKVFKIIYCFTPQQRWRSLPYLWLNRYILYVLSEKLVSFEAILRRSGSNCQFHSWNVQWDENWQTKFVSNFFYWILFSYKTKVLSSTWWLVTKENWESENPHVTVEKPIYIHRLKTWYNTNTMDGW